jgi:hypothetical protein
MTHLGTIRGRSRQADHFAALYFGQCEAHAAEARAVYDATERLRRQPLEHLDLDATVGDVVGQSLGPAGGRDSLDRVEQLMAIEEEFGPETVTADGDVTHSLLSAAVMRVLLGEVAERSSWSGETIWARSFRGIINERVRWRGGCMCAQMSRRPTTR